MSAFVPARSKLEAVTRISALTHSPPETLGPGSKERKSVLVNLAVGLDLNVATNATKVDLGADIAAAIGAKWDESCWSAGQTVTLVGLNRILEAGEDWLAWRAKTFGNPCLSRSKGTSGRSFRRGRSSRLCPASARSPTAPQRSGAGEQGAQVGPGQPRCGSRPQCRHPRG